MRPDSLDTSSSPAGSRLRVRVYCVAAALLALFLLPATPASAAVVVQLSPSPAAPQPVSTTITWTASASDPNPGTLEYQFSVRPPEGDFAVVRDFSPSTSFEWTPSEREGSYDIRVTARNATTKEAAQLVVSYSASSRVTGDSPVVSATSNPMVALYSAPACAAGSMRVRFWRTGDFSSSATSWKSCRPGVSMNFYVAGMLANTQYSMRHEISSDPGEPLTTGPTLSFLTGAPPAEALFPSTSVLTPSPGDSGQDVLLSSSLGGATFPVKLNATDLSGRLLWYYDRQVFLGLRPVEGGSIFVLPFGSWQDTLREIDLAGNTLRETNIQTVSDQLLARGEQAITSFHHDARRLPDGHTVVLATVERTLSGVQGPGAVNILGDMILVLDNDWQVVWSWNAFDHLDVTRRAVLGERCNRQPGCATSAASANDWLHSNSVAYSPADGNLLLSVRHQDWVIKIDYQDGSGTGDVIWRLGKDGDFTTDSADPYPWFSHQHDVEYEADGRLTIYDNGNTRQLFPNATANSRGQVLSVDEQARTVTVDLNADLGVYSPALGSAQKLSNGSYHFLSGFLNGVGARTSEVGPGGDLGFTLQSNVLTYRTFRMRDLYALDRAGEDQTISFEAIGDHAYGAPFTLEATASSGLPVTFRVVSGPATVNGNIITLTGTGAVTLQADQYGNIKYNEAPSVRRSFAVEKGAQTVTIGALPDKMFGDAPFSVAATGGGSGNPINFTAAGNCTSGGANGATINITGAGSCTVTASQSGDGNFDAAPDVSRTFNINKAAATITLHDLSQTYDGAAKAANATTSPSGLNLVSISYARGGVPVNVPIDAGSYDVTATLSNADYQAADVMGTLVVNRAGQTINFGPLSGKNFSDADFTVDATATSTLAVSFAASGACTVTGSTIHITGAGVCTVTATQSGNANYSAAPNVERSFTVAKANQTITFAALTDKSFGSAPFALSASASSGLPVSFNVASGPASISGNTLTITGTGTVTVSASQAGSIDYNAAPNVNRSFTVARADQTITFGALADRIFGDPDFPLSANASSGLAVSFAASGNCTVTGSTVQITGAGVCTVTATQAGNANYNAATNVERSFQVAMAATATAVSSSTKPSAFGRPLTFTALVTSAAGTPTGTVQFKADGTNLGSPVALSAGGVATLTTSSLPAGMHAVTADYGGDANFKASAGALSVGQVVGASLEFLKATYAVGERDGSVTITVRRVGDTSQAVSVNYSTDDGSTPSVAVPCSSVTGLALERCDYTLAAGRLQFAAGEQEKSFVVLVNDDSFVEGVETLSLRLSAPSEGAALGTIPSAALEIAEDSPESTGNPIDDDETFVRQQYRDFLGREADADGLKFWADGIKVCGADAGCREVKRIDTSAAFFLSIEFQETGYLAYRTYKAAYGDATSPGVAGTVPFVRLNEFLADTQRIGQGVIVNSLGWEQRLAENKQAYALEFVRRPEFLARYPAQTNATAFVNLLDQNAGGVLSPGEKSALISELSSNPSDAALRASVLRKVAEDADLVSREFDRAFVLMQFYGYLRRNPDDAPEKDLNFAGWKFWLDKLESFGGDYRRAEMVKAFITSNEYRQRFGQ